MARPSTELWPRIPLRQKLKNLRWDTRLGVIPESVPVHYRTALYNTLLELEPTLCLEIGTGTDANTARVFARYLQEHKPYWGMLVTCDVYIHKRFPLDRVRQIVVCPHDTEMLARYHRKSDKQVATMLEDWQDLAADSVSVNVAILQEQLKQLGRSAFDFAFVDGDHSQFGLWKDLRIVEAVTTWPHYALLDDVLLTTHESGQFYQDTLKLQYETYEFGDWPFATGTALLWRG